MEDRDVIIPTSEPSTRFEFDFDKIKTVEDVIRIIKALRISFGERYPAFEEVKDLLKEVNESEQ